ESRPYWKNWGWEQIRMPSAWSYLHEVKERTAVGVVDGGVMIEHEDLAFLGVSDKRTIIEDVYDGLSTYQHGTHISSIIASKANNQKGIVGVFPPAQLSAVMLGRLLTQSRQIRAINDLVITQKAKVVNISLGTSYSLPSWLNWLDHNTNIAFKIISNAEGNARSAINALISLGYEFILVTAAGNDSKNAKWSSGFNAISDGITKDHVIVVGATGRLNTSTHWIDYDDVAQYSDYGDSVDVLAPGTMIFGARICSKSSGRSGMNVAIGGRPQTQITSSTSGSGTATAISTNVSVSSTAGASVTVDTSSLPASDELLTQDAESRSCYGSAYGTSFAAPFVSGVAAFVWGINPDLSAKEVKEIILEAAKEYKSISRTDPDGVARTYFILDAKGAVERAIAQRNATTTEGGFDRIAMTRFTLGNVDRIRPLCAVKDHFYVPFAVLGHPIGGSQNEHQFLRGDELRSVVDTISIENTAVAVVDGDIRPKNVGITSVSARYGALRTSQALGIFPTTWESLTGSTIVKDGCKFMLASPIGLCEYAEGPSRQVLGIRSSDGSIISNSVVIENCEIVQNWSNILVYTP
ncbi:MAG: S8 family serine peptidase, partial [Thiotrichales bacterium]